MRLRVIATDYDGTIAVDGVLNSEVRTAIAAARSRGILVVIVTGRILSELRDVTGGLEFVDGVVAENGAVVSLAGGHTLALGAAPPMTLLTALTERGIDFKVGRCVVEMDAQFSDVAISLIREQQLPLAITFNRQRMMLLPASISKSTGLRELLATMGISLHNCLGIGDAENDHELLRCSEYGVAVEWGARNLQEAADETIKGAGPEAVGAYIERVSQLIRIPLERRGHHKVVVESIEGQPPLEMVIRGRNVLIAGDTQSGKSWLAGLLTEQMIMQGYTVYVFDPEGDYCSLGSLPNTVVLGGGRLLPHFDDLLMLLHQGLSVVLDLSHLCAEAKADYVRQHLPLIAKYRRRQGFPHRIVLDECHYFLNDEQSISLLDLDLSAYTLVTWKPSGLAPTVATAMDIVTATRLVNKSEVDALSRIAGEQNDPADWYEPLANLGVTEAALLPPTDEANGQLHRFRVAPRLTSHVRHRTKYLDSPASPANAFLFSDCNIQTGQTATTLCELIEGIRTCVAGGVQAHMERHDFSRWIGHVFGDIDLAGVIRKLESAHQNDRCTSDFTKAILSAISDRYDAESSVDIDDLTG